MSQDFDQVLHLSRKKCPNCGLVNTGSDEVCRRCGAPLDHENLAEPVYVPEPLAAKSKNRPFVKRVIWIVTTTVILLIAFYTTLLLTSDGLNADQHDKVGKAISLINERGFTREAFLLNRLASFRANDNWLNAYVGHRDAYAATNFPFEIITLYPEFFEVPVDDCERAAVLLHEAHHLLGEGEDAALEHTWKSKRQLGWTTDKYGHSKVWDATMRLTKSRFPYLFQCGSDGQTDCL